MSDEQLLFAAGDAASEALRLVKAAWDADVHRLPHPDACRLVELSRRLSCASAEMECNSRGVPAVQIGD